MSAGARRRVVIAGVLAAFVAACAGPSSTPPLTIWPTPTGSPAPASSSSPSPSVSAGTASPSATLPPGASVIDRAFGFGAVTWSPDGSAVAAEALGQTVGTGSVDLFSPAGLRLASIPGYDFGWLDGTHLLVYETTPNDAASGRVSEWTSAGHLVERLPGTFGGLLANGHGAALLRRAPPAHAYAGNDFQFWADGHLSPMITAPGVPAGWSPDGRLVAITESTATVRGSGGVVFASTGGPIMSFLHVLRYPDGSVLRPFRDHPINLQGGVAFSPDSRYVAAADYAGEGVLVFDRATGGVTPVRVPASLWQWAPDRQLAITGPDGTTMLWSPSGTLVPSRLPAGFPVWGSSMDDVALLPVGQPPGIAVTLRTPTADTSVPVNTAGRFAVAWAPDATSCLLATASTVNGAADELLRVPLG